MQIRTMLTALLCLSLSLSAYAQTDSSTTKSFFSKPKKPVNFTKLELVYQKGTEQVTTHYRSPSGIGSYDSHHYVEVTVPYIRINGGELRKLDKRGNILRPYYTKAPLANEQLRLANQQFRRAKVQGYVLVGIGTAAMVAGLFTIPDNGENEEFSSTYMKALVRILPGLAIFGTGSGLYFYHNKKADKHIKQSIDIYNSQYYKPIKVDSTINKPGIADSTTLKSPAPAN